MASRTPPQSRRRASPRRSAGTPPARLGVNDGFCEKVAREWATPATTAEQKAHRKHATTPAAKWTTWERYERLLKSDPIRMQMLQAFVLALLGNLCNQCVLSSRPFDARLLAEQLSVNLLLAPATIWWLRWLSRWRLHWVTSALVDQLTYNVVANVCLFYFIAAVFRGGVRVLPSPRIDVAAFPSVLSYEPMWATRVRGFQTKLPTTLLREKAVPAHLKGAWELLVRFVWSIFIAAKLAAWTR